jgi:hypothetical protein
MASSHLTSDVRGWIDELAKRLDPRVSWRLVPLLSGLLFATGRPQGQVAGRRAGGDRRAGDRAQRPYLAGHRRHAQQTLRPQSRRGRRASQSDAWAGGQPIHLRSQLVTLAWVTRHALWGAIALPLLACLYVRRKDIAAQHLPMLRKVTFKTKLILAGELVSWAATWLRGLSRRIWVVADGAYGKRVFLKSAAAARVTVVSRLRKDAALFEVPAALGPAHRLLEKSLQRRPIGSVL